jgi:hypothetical protein
MARVFLTALAGILAIGATACADAPELAVDTPLFVFDTYPANGATIAASDLREVAVTFSSDLGPADDVRADLDRHLELDAPSGPLAVLRPDRTNVAYDDEHFTLRVLLDPEVRARLAPGPYTLVVREGLEAADGRVLPVDYAARFVVAP